MQESNQPQWLIYSFGRLLPGFRQNQVVDKLDAIFKITEPQALKIISYKTLIKSCDSEALADQYKAKLEEIGLAVFVEAPIIEPVFSLALVEDEKVSAELAVTLCPKCGVEQLDAKALECHACGVIIAKALARKLEQQQAQPKQDAWAGKDNNSASANSGTNIVGRVFKNSPYLFLIIAAVLLYRNFMPATVDKIASTTLAEAQLASLEHARQLPIPDPLQIRNAVRDASFAAIESRLTRMHDEMADDVQWEYPLIRTLEAFSSANGIRESHLNDWVAAKQSALSYIARGYFYMNEGWAVRGHDYANKTEKEKLKAFEALHKLAKQDFEEAMRIEPNWLPIYTGLMIVAKSQPDLDASDILDKAEALYPAGFSYRKEYAVYIAPKWFGSQLEQMLFERHIKPQLTLNPRLSYILGYRHSESGRLAKDEQAIAKCLRHYNDALAYAVTALWLHKRAYCAMKDGQYKASVADATLSLTLEHHQHVVQIKQYSQRQL